MMTPAKHCQLSNANWKYKTDRSWSYILYGANSVTGVVQIMYIFILIPLTSGIQV